MTNEALSGLRVLEYGNLISAPYCTKLFADLGAEVIKIEDPERGDEARGLGPFAEDTPHPEMSGLFLYLNTNKLGITLNLRSTTGRDIFKELVKQADAFVENNPPKVMEELGLDYESLSQLNPRLVMTSITPFGLTGPYRDYKAHDLHIWQMGGIGYLSTLIYPTVVFTHRHRSRPLRAGGRQADFTAAMHAAVATMTALLAGDAIGSGQQVDLSAQEAVASVGSEAHVPRWTYAGDLEVGERGWIVYPIGLFPCRDGYVNLFCVDDWHWDNLMKLMGNPEWASQEIFKDRFIRGENWQVLEVLLADWFKERSVAEVYQAARRERVPLFPANTVADVLASVHLAERGFFEEIEHPVAGRAKYPGAPYKLSRTPWRVVRPAPLLGEHNEEVYLKRLGFTRQDLVKLRESGVI